MSNGVNAISLLCEETGQKIGLDRSASALHSDNAASLADALDNILHLAVSIFDGREGAIGRFGPAGLEMAAHAGGWTGQLDAASMLALGLESARQGAPVLISATASAPSRGGAGRPLTGMAAALMGRDGKPHGVFAVVGEDAGRPVRTEDRDRFARFVRSTAALIDGHAAASRADDFHALFQRVPAPLWIYDPESLAILDMNETACALYGYRRDAILRMTVLDLRPEAEHERAVAAIRARSDLQDPSLWRHQKADGTGFDVVTLGRPVPFGGREAILALALDRTDVQSLQASLGETRLLLDTIVESLPVGVFLKDMADGGRYLVYNAAGGEAVGRHSEDIVGRRDEEIFGADLAERFADQDRKVMNGVRQLLVSEETLTRPDGNVRWLRTVKKPLPSGNATNPRFLLGIMENVTEKRQSKDRLAHMALHDALTGLPNRTFFKKRLDDLLVRRQDPAQVAVFYIDLDFFKAINDTYGHHVGDLLLKEVAKRLKASVRRSDVVARLGGDEFAVMSKVSTDRDAIDLAERVLAAFDRPFDLEDCVAHVDSSIGIAMTSGERESGETLMRYADMALYAAKAEGRGLSRLYTESMSSFFQTRHLMTEDLRLAIRDEQFELVYQPLYDIASAEISVFEALIRWRHPIRGLISPGEFIPLAEQTGLIVPIGTWVLREACRQAATWPRGVKVAVNLSAVQFKKADFVAMVKAALADTGLEPRRLELEVTESVLLNDDSNIEILRTLRALGIRIAMDDFGTGYSSLSYLRRFPFDKIKMDRSFVTDVCQNPESLAIVRAVTGLGSSLSITTTAEGIETAEQFAKLKAEGFDELQGFLIGRPMPAAEALALAHSRAGSMRAS